MSKWQRTGVTSRHIPYASWLREICVDLSYSAFCLTALCEWICATWVSSAKHIGLLIRTKVTKENIDELEVAFCCPILHNFELRWTLLNRWNSSTIHHRRFSAKANIFRFWGTKEVGSEDGLNPFPTKILTFLPRCMECRRGLTMRFLSVCLSVCLSVKRVHCDKTEERYV